jgi:hypothetical protein
MKFGSVLSISILWTSFKGLGEFSGESIWSWAFLCWETLHYCFNFIAWYGYI